MPAIDVSPFPKNRMTTGQQPSRLLLLTPTLHTIGGVETYYRALELHLHEPRIDYFFVTGGGRESKPALAYRLVRNYLRFWRLMAGSTYRLVVINPSLNPHSFYRDAIFCWLAMRVGVRVLVFFRGWSEQFEARLQRPSLPRFLFLRCFAKADGFIVLGTSFKRKLMRLGCKAESPFWVETTVADAAFLPEFSIESRAPPRTPVRLLFLSRIVASKGAELAVRSFQIARERLGATPIELLMAGDGPDLTRIRKLVEDEGIPDVRFTGAVEGAEKQRVLFEADILLFPTMHDEGMPNAILEAMLYGLPILTRAVGAIPDIVEDGKNGFLTDEVDPRVFARWIERLSTDSELRFRISRTNHDEATRLYATDIVRRRILRILRDNLAV